jgi:histidine kinase
MSPERTGNINKFIDYNSDLYSLGIVFYEILTGFTPFHEVNDLLTLYHFQIAKKPISVFNINNKIPLVISNIIDKLLEKNPEKRYKSALELLFDLKKCKKNLKDLNNYNWRNANGRTDFFIDNFELMKFESSCEFFLSNSFLGRDKEILIVDNCLKRFFEKKEKIFLTILGESGIG